MEKDTLLGFLVVTLGSFVITLTHTPPLPPHGPPATRGKLRGSSQTRSLSHNKRNRAEVNDLVKILGI